MFGLQARNICLRCQRNITRARPLPTQRFRHFSRISRLEYKVIRPNSLRDGIDPSLQLRSIPSHIKKPEWYETASTSPWDPNEIVATTEDVQGMRIACKLAKEALRHAESLVKVGVSTDTIDERIHDYIVSKNAYPSPLNYGGFPKSVCTSINNVIAHGIPDARKLADGDMINVDITVYTAGYHGDTSATFSVGELDSVGRHLIDATRESLYRGIRVCGPGVPYKEIGNVISSFAKEQNLSVVFQMSGHGIGKYFHQLPYILHHKNDEPGTMKVGQIFTIEPSLCEGEAEGIMFPDGWTVSTADWKRSAQFEHTVLITENGVEILTQ